VEEIERVARSLRDQWRVQSIAPGHCTGEPGFDVLRRVFGDAYRHAGLGMRVPI
jgi:7,8-dihydropterin-6-yl-methyl-4-(beta-D-ribofuranosyl)aminobenzene 5'-phosphate synthase